jgi:tRNA threonylcarbamoyladenosine biosynthesis protein TsaB
MGVVNAGFARGLKFPSMLAPQGADSLCVRVMPSLRQILKDHAPLLLLDAASEQIQVAVLEGLDVSHWACAKTEAGTGLFECLEQLQAPYSKLAGFVFCEGPGSILGVRTCAAAIRAWNVESKRPVWAYKSLELVAQANANPELKVISDARRDSWHLAQTGLALRRVPTAELHELGNIASPEGFRRWTKLPESLDVQTLSYRLETLLPLIADLDLFHPSDAPDAFLHEEPSYLTWTPQIHRASP